MTSTFRFTDLDFFGARKCISPSFERILLPTTMLYDAPVNNSPLGSESLSQEGAESSTSKINADVFDLIVANLLRKSGGFQDLFNFSMCCRWLRYLSLPTLFSRCAIKHGISDLVGIPPLAIRPHVRHLTYYWKAYFTGYIQDDRQPEYAAEFGLALRYLPQVRSLTFTAALDGIPWEALKLCLGFPQIKSIEFTTSAQFVHVPTFPTDACSTASTLEELSYPTPLMLRQRLILDPDEPYQDDYALESACLSTLVLGMSSTARSLVLPMRTAPFRNMATVDWPALQSLTLSGAFLASTDPSITEHMSSAFLRMPALQRLIATAALPHSPLGRCCIYGNKAPPANALQDLRSITIAYPDPSDNIFSTPLPRLTKLALRDWPRHYDIVEHGYYSSRWMSPIMSATEALSLLRRLRAPRLSYMELVYAADDADYDLLAFIAHELPRLKHLELHRYRRDEDDPVDFRHIAQVLSASKRLVTLRMNLDFPDDPGDYNPYSGNKDAIKSWRAQLAEYGWDVLEALRPCRTLTAVALLFRGDAPGMWIWYKRSRRVSRRPVEDSYRDTFPAPWPFNLKVRARIGGMASCG